MNKIQSESLEKCAYMRMSKMNFDNLMEVLNEYNQLNMITLGNPLYYYLCNYKPFLQKKILRQSQIKFFNKKHKEMKTMLFFVKRRRLLNHKTFFKKGKENPINFISIQRNNLFFQRYEQMQKKICFIEKNKKIILIQKFCRGYLKRVKVLRIINHIIVSKMINSILLIQKYYRSYKTFKEFRINFLINLILNNRIKKSNLIKRYIKRYKNIIKLQKNFIINNIIKQREQSAKYIQGFYKMKKISKKIKEIIAYEKTHYVLDYPFYAKSVQIKIFLDKKLKNYKNFTFNLCPIRKNFYCYIDYNEIPSKNFYTQLIVDGIIMTDGRFPYTELSNGKYYNILSFKTKDNNFSLNNILFNNSMKATDDEDDSKNNRKSSNEMNNNQINYNNNNYNNNNINQHYFNYTDYPNDSVNQYNKKNYQYRNINNLNNNNNSYFKTSNLTNTNLNDNYYYSNGNNNYNFNYKNNNENLNNNFNNNNITILNKPESIFEYKNYYNKNPLTVNRYEDNDFNNLRKNLIGKVNNKFT